ncbi:MAG: DEAD/DEAH box helicase family protein [Paludibacteraceae bacterium]|nr:DEAD/DEAH box helicase family protein [Paludibacteraceae bacterium]
MELYEHNREAYEKVIESFRTKDKVAIVHATGTGKSYVIASVANNFDKVLVIAPNNFVLNETRKVCKNGVEFRTYASVMYDETPNQYDLIVLDEFHRGGAEKWGVGVQQLLDANKKAKILGTSATHIRYLDNNRNMADELFEGNIVSYLPLKDAMDKGILPTPTYVASLYSMKDVESDYNQRIKDSRLSQERKEEYLRQLKGIAGSWEQSHGVPQIIRKYFDKEMQRIIVFCSNVNKAKQVRELLNGWFVDAGYRKIRFYNIDYQEKRLEKEMADFQEPVSDGELKVAISVNMLNEGVHIPRVDGVIMLRSTISRIIIEQQIGRCLTADNKHRTPVVLDLVNNMDLISYDAPTFTDGNKEQEHSGESGKDSNAFPFSVIDECRDIRVFFEQMDNETCNLHVWTEEELRQIALKYTNRKDFYTLDSAAYRAALRKGILQQIMEHMPSPTKRSKEECAEVALLYKTRKEFEKNEVNVAAYARRHGWMDEICAHMQNVKVKWTIKKCQKVASQYNTYIEFIRNEPNAYASARHNGWLDKIQFGKKRIVWTKEMCQKEAQKYKTKTEFDKGSHSAWRAAQRYGWMEDVCAHMQKPKKNGYTNKEIKDNGN